MQRTRQILLVILTSRGFVSDVRAECWLRNDGHEICSPDPLAWRIAWWFWFATLILIFVYMGCWRQCCFSRVHPEGANSDEKKESSNAVDDNGGKAQLTEPLLEQPLGKENSSNQTHSPVNAMVKPVYRYLDP